MQVIRKRPGMSPELVEIEGLGGALLESVGTELYEATEETVDDILWDRFKTARYTRADRPHNVWKCRHCGHLEQMEADGPYENGWDYCPGCGGWILRPET